MMKKWSKRKFLELILSLPEPLKSSTLHLPPTNTSRWFHIILHIYSKDSSFSARFQSVVNKKKNIYLYILSEAKLL